MNEIRRYINLIESANEDVNVLSALADVIIDKLPSIIDRKKITIPAGNFDESTFTTLINQYPKHKQLIYQSLKNTNYHFNNDPSKSSDGGELLIYDTNRPNDLIISISDFIGGDSNLTKKDLLSFRNDSASVITLKTLIVHELRHIWQEVTYGGYQGKNQRYDTTPDELDAAWIHMIHDHDINKFDDIKEFTDSVMDKFSKYKTLSDKLLRHYTKKTKRYWYQHHNPMVTKDKGDIDDRLKSFKEKKLDKLKQTIKTAENSRLYYNLLNFPEYEKYKLSDDVDANTLPKDALFNLVELVITNRMKGDDLSLLSYAVGFFALINIHHPLDIKYINEILKKYYDMDKSKAIDYIRNNNFISDKYNKDFFINIIKSTF